MTKSTYWRLNYWLSYKSPWARARSAWRRWRKRDRRERGYSKAKYAIDRDGDLYLVECPQCHTQDIHHSEKRGRFECYRCDAAFTVYTEDGVRKITDHRGGDAALPAIVAIDPNGHSYHLGISRDAPWWWDRRAMYRDLRDGKDAHGHKAYEVVETLSHGATTANEQEGDKPTP